MHLIAETSELERFVAGLVSPGRVALDTEAASFHRYIDRVYLIQLSTDEDTAIIDPLAVGDLSPIGRLLGDPTIEIVLHDADYDLRTLNRDHGFAAANLFDTKVAAELAGEPAIGLSALLEKHFGVRLNKKFQRADWSARPLSEEMLAYAADDTRFLLRLRDLLERKLQELGRLEWAREEFARLEATRWTATPVTDAYLRIKGARRLRLPQLAILRELYTWRDATARRLDRAPFRVLGNAALLATAQAQPGTMADLSAVQGMPRTVAARWGTELLDTVARSRALPDAEMPRPKRRTRTSPDADYDRRLERLKELRNCRAQELNMGPGLLCPNGTLQLIAHAAGDGELRLGDIEELRHWQRKLLGEREVLAAVARET